MSKSLKQILNTLGEIALGIIILLGIVFFIGELFDDKSAKETKDIEPKHKPENKLKKKKERLALVVSRIAELNPQRKKIERRILIGTRWVIAIGLVAYNIICLWLAYDWNFDLGNQMNVNGAAVMLYSFTAFILYGTPDNLVKEFKRKSKLRLKRKHIPMLSELKNLEQERDDLFLQISGLGTIDKSNLDVPKQLADNLKLVKQ